MALVTLLLSAPLMADDQPRPIDGIYRGTIGRQQVVVEMGLVLPRSTDPNDGTSGDRRTYPIEGRYFYRRHGVDIHLVGMPLEDGAFRLREYKRLGDPWDEFGAEWRLAISGGQATGIFCKCDLSRVPTRSVPVLKIHLKRVSRHFHKEFDPDPVFDRLRLDFPIKNGPDIRVTQQIAYRMRTDPRFTAAWPQLTQFPDMPVMVKINAEMAAELHWDRLRAATNLSEAQFETSNGGFYDERTTVNFFLPQVLSLRVYRSWYWGGAHPNYSRDSLNYDLRTGKRFSLKNAFRTATGSTEDADVAALLARLYRRHYVKPPSIAAAEDCNVVLRRIIANTEDLIEGFSPDDEILFMSSKGLAIRPVFKYADSGCSPDITVPYNEVRPFVRKHSMLRWVVERETSLHQ